MRKSSDVDSHEFFVFSDSGLIRIHLSWHQPCSSLFLLSFPLSRLFSRLPSLPVLQCAVSGQLGVFIFRGVKLKQHSSFSVPTLKSL